MNNCQQCNFVNQPNARFCNNCGAALATGARDLPPTVFGAPLPPVNQPSQFQNQPNFAPPTHQQQFPPNPSPVSFPPTAADPRGAPPKSNAKKFMITGGILGLLLLLVGGFALWRTVIEPRMAEKRRAQTEIDNQNRANRTTAMSLVPSEFGASGGDVYRRRETIDKIQLLEVAQSLPPAMKQKTAEMNDAAAAVFVSDKNSTQKTVLQIFKFNTPEQAYNTCLDMVGEIERNRERFKKVDTFPRSIRPSYCTATVEGKNNENISIQSLYGFLSVATGSYVTGLNARIHDQLSPY